MGIVVLGAVFVDIKGYPLSAYIPGGRNAGRIEQVHGGVSRNVVEDIANVELRPTFVSLVDDTGMGQDVINKLELSLIHISEPTRPYSLTTTAMCMQPFPSGRTPLPSPAF